MPDPSGPGVREGVRERSTRIGPASVPGGS
jgi:hypothetical protein